MASLEVLLKRVAASNERIAKMDAARAAATERRDGEIEAALQAGATWAVLQSAGLSRQTIANARERVRRRGGAASS